MRRRQVIGFVVLCVVCAIGAVTYAVAADRRVASVSSTGGSGDDSGPSASTVSLGPHVLFRSTTVDSHFGEIGAARLDALDQPPAWTGLRCERVAFAGDRGICLTIDQGVITTYSSIVFDQNYQTLFTTQLPGLPSRARVSADGRYGATTTFVYGDSYAAATFSTRTELLDLRSGESLGDLEQFEVTKDGQPFDAVDHNFWGVTFATDSNRFYATLATGGHTYLVVGDLAARRLDVVTGDVECPSLSPDGTRVAFKKRTSGDLGRVEWRLSVLDLATLEEHPLAETASVDDQAAWLDDAHVLYALPTAQSGTPSKDTWVVPADGSGAPSRFLEGAYSTVVVD